MIQSERLYDSRLWSIEVALLYFVFFGAIVSTFLFFWGEHGYVLPGIATEVVREVTRPKMRVVEPKKTPPPEVRYIPEGTADRTILVWYQNAFAGNPKAHVPPELFFSAIGIEGHRTQAVSGDLRNLSSLDALLAGSGLRWRVTDHGRILVVSELPAPAEPKTRQTSGRGRRLSHEDVFWIQLDDPPQ